MQIENIGIKTVKPHPRNVRQGDVGAISESLRLHGQYKPIVVQRSTGHILAGNHTWRAAKALKWTHIDAVFADVDDDEAVRILLVDNRTADLAAYDDHALLELLAAVNSTGGLDGTGFDGDAIDTLIADLAPPPASDPASEAAPRGDTDSMGVCPTCGHVI